MNARNICSITGVALAIAGLIIVLGVSDSLATDLLGLALFFVGCAVGLLPTKAPTIAWRELSSYFVSPIAYILIAMHLLMVAIIFNDSVLVSQRAELEPLFGNLTWLALILCPVITMRLLAEEARSGTLETILTAPITDVELALGKFIGGFGFFVAVHVPTLVFIYIMARQGSPDYGIIAASYAGLLLLGALLISIGLFISAFTKNQVIAAFVGFVAMFGMFIIGRLGTQIPGEVNIPGLAIAVVVALGFAVVLSVVLYQSIRKIAVPLVVSLVVAVGGIAACVIGRAGIKEHISDFAVKPGQVLHYIGLGSHYMDFTRGIVSSQHVLYYLTLSVFFLFLTVRMIESHRWR
ncbi:MAG: ABC transporter permease subunit [Planctomycetes bacterium]|nr:ABC transporter permease subunit [Planctomycetota bacterium]